MNAEHSQGSGDRAAAPRAPQAATSQATASAYSAYTGPLSENVPKRVPPTHAQQASAHARGPSGNPPEPPSFRKSLPSPSSFGKIHWVWIALLALMLQLPVYKISLLISERQATRDEVEAHITARWGKKQVLSGPILSVPYLFKWTNSKGQPEQEKRHAYVLPETLDFDARVDPEARKRGIFEIPVYALKARITGRFNTARLAAMGIPAHNMLWDEARLIMPFSDVASLTERPKVTWRNRALEAAPAGNGAPVAGSLEAAAPLNPDGLGVEHFALEVKANGSQQVLFMPHGRETTARVASTWKSPSFIGSMIPRDRKTEDSGFSAAWAASAITRAYPQQWTSVEKPGNMEGAWSESAFGVDFVSPTDTYAKTARSVKYSLLFITMTFVIFYLIELFRRSRVHMLQYALVGLSLCLFYLLLLSLAEHMAFGLAYALSLLAVLSLTGLYAWAVFGRAADALGISAALAALYGYLYVVLNAEHHALLFGTLGLLCMLAVLMYATRKLNAGDAGAGPAG